MESQTNAFQALLDAGADIKSKDNNGDSLLYKYFKTGITLFSAKEMLCYTL